MEKENRKKENKEKGGKNKKKITITHDQFGHATQSSKYNQPQGFYDSQTVTLSLTKAGSVIPEKFV